MRVQPLTGTLKCNQQKETVSRDFCETELRTMSCFLRTASALLLQRHGEVFLLAFGVLFSRLRVHRETAVHLVKQERCMQESVCKLFINTNVP